MVRKTVKSYRASRVVLQLLFATMILTTPSVSTVYADEQECVTALSAAISSYLQTQSDIESLETARNASIDWKDELELAFNDVWILMTQEDIDDTNAALNNAETYLLDTLLEHSEALVIWEMEMHISKPRSMPMMRLRLITPFVKAKLIKR